MVWRWKDYPSELLGQNKYYKGNSHASLVQSVVFDYFCENNIRIQARPEILQSAELFKIKELTLDHVVVWFDRRFYVCKKSNVRCELNPDFDRHHPRNYQWLRVQVSDDGIYHEQTRQAACLFCEKLKFWSVIGYDGLLQHYNKWHPRELPEFVKKLFDELELVEADKIYPTHARILQVSINSGLPWPPLSYPVLTTSDQMRFSPTKRGEEQITGLDINEELLRFYFHRNMSDMWSLPHETVGYLLNPLYDDQNPVVTQILRVVTEKFVSEIPKTKQMMCLYCQRATFIDWSPRCFLDHMFEHHKLYFPNLDELDVEKYFEEANMYTFVNRGPFYLPE